MLMVSSCHCGNCHHRLCCRSLVVIVFVLVTDLSQFDSRPFADKGVNYAPCETEVEALHKQAEVQVEQEIFIEDCVVAAVFWLSSS